MIGLRDRTGAVGEMIRAPQQTGPSRLKLSFRISPVALPARKRRFVNDTDNAFAFHRDKIDPHQIVVGQIHDGVAGKGGERQEQKGKNTNDEFHGRKVTREFSSATAAYAKEVGGQRSEVRGQRTGDTHATAGN